jgi:hypothetical protein
LIALKRIENPFALELAGNVLHAEDDGQGDCAGRGGKCEEPCGSGREARDFGRSLARAGRGQLTGTEFLGDPHGGDHACHVYAGRIRCDDPIQASVAVFGRQVQLAPARHDPGPQPKHRPQTLARGHGLLR